MQMKPDQRSGGNLPGKVMWESRDSSLTGTIDRVLFPIYMNICIWLNISIIVLLAAHCLNEKYYGSNNRLHFQISHHQEETFNRILNLKSIYR